VVLRGRTVALLRCFRTDRGDRGVVTRTLFALKTVSVPLVLAALAVIPPTLAVILPALPLSGHGMCREQRHDEHQSEQAASE
jgi:hypothetical protein